MKQTKNYTVDMVWIPDKTSHNILQTFARNFLSRIQFTKHPREFRPKSNHERILNIEHRVFKLYY